jgi:hypothetical protein
LLKGEADVRTVGIGCFFVKLLASVCLRLDDPASLLPAWQLGQAKNGCHKVIRNVVHEYNGGSTVMTVDVENAHNMIGRQAIWDALLSRRHRLKYTSAYFRLCYALPTKVHFQRRGNDWLSITTSVGVRQGDCVASFCYNLTTADAMAPVVSSIRDGEFIYAVHDDTTFTSCDPTSFIDLFKSTQRCLEAIGLRLNRSKCEILSRPACITAATAKGVARDLGVKFVDGAHSSIRILGGHVGAEAACAAYVDSKCDDTLQLIAKVAKLGPAEPRAAVALLKFCCQPKLLYRFSVHPPEICQAAALRYDDAIMAALRSFLGEDILRDFVVSSFGLNFADYPKALPILYDRFLSNCANVGDVKADPLLEMRTAHDATLLLRFPHLKARMVSFGASSGIGGTGWASPFLPTEHVADPADVILLLRFLLLADTHPPESCFCGEHNKRDGSFLQHVLTCSMVRGANRVYRHNLINVALDHNIRRFGVFTHLEPLLYEYADGSRKRPDLTAFTSPPIATDLVVTISPTDALVDKAAKHGQAVFARGHKFAPIAVGVFGDLHTSVYEFLRQVFAQLMPSTKNLAVKQTMRAMSEAWITGTAAIIRGIRKNVQDERDMYVGGFDILGGY